MLRQGALARGDHVILLLAKQFGVQPFLGVLHRELEQVALVPALGVREADLAERRLRVVAATVIL